MRAAHDACDPHRDMRGLVIKILRGAYPPLPRSFSSELSALVGTWPHTQCTAHTVHLPSVRC